LFTLFVVFFLFYKLFFLQHPLPVHEELTTEQFIKRHLTNELGLLSTNLKNGSTDVSIPSGKDSLSESLGLWMQYSVRKQDKILFHQSYNILKQYFLTDEHTVVWKVEEDGTQAVLANALIDDLRIIEALLQAHELWGDYSYKLLALDLAKSIVKKNEYKGYLVDFYDPVSNSPGTSITLSFIDFKVLQTLQDMDIIEDDIVSNLLHLYEIPHQQELFYPYSYRIDEKKYVYQNEVHMIDQLYIAYHLAKMNRVHETFIHFLKDEMTKGKIYGRYDRITHFPTVNYESPAIYGLAILLSLEANETELSMKLYHRLKEMKIQENDHPYAGGYINQKTYETHIFDNLLPLLAERMMKNEGLLHE